MRVLLADDHGLFRAGLASLLKAWGLKVVGEAANGKEAVEKARELAPDLIFMDVSMPEMNGLDATRAIKAESPDIKIVILTVSDDDHDLFDAIKSGAEGYLLKNLREEEFEDLVDRIGRGEPVMSPGIAKKLLVEFARLKKDREPPEATAGITDRERDVLQHVARGTTNREIAAALFISENTVNFHMKNILSKLHLRNRAEVVGWALEHGISPHRPPPDPIKSADSLTGS
ncbi:MAG: response regulator transcription factor [Chloroflexi bacterium]|nr:response regulator transcription factor [Chloroflexota bacterium]